MPSQDELPAQHVDWSADPRRAVLLVHDMQEYFLRFFPAGQSPVTELVKNAARLRHACEPLGIPVIYSAQPGAMTARQRGLLMTFWGPGMTAEETDRAVVPELAPRPQDRVLTKWRYSAFHRTPLADLLWESGRDQIIVCGVYAHVGCLVTALDAFSRDVQPFLVADAVADFSSERHGMALSVAAGCCAATPVTDRVLADLADLADRGP